MVSGVNISKQAIEERMNHKTETFLKTAFQELFKQERVKDNKKIVQRFGNVYCEDSTHIHLPENLAHHYPGNISRGKEKAVAKLHVLYNMSTDRFALLDIHSFRKNDQCLAPVSVNHLQKGDLLLRDLGFLVLSCIKTFLKNEIYFLSRKNYQVKVFDVRYGQEMKLSKIMKRKKFFDSDVLVGKDKQRMRMIIMPVSSEQVAIRKRKARKNRDKRLNHSKEYYALLGYTILLTNIEKAKCSASDAIKLYGLRWRIETVFKCWKSVFSMQKVIPSKCKNVHRINCIIW